MAPDIFKKPKPDLYWGARTGADQPTSQARLELPDRPVHEGHLSGCTQLLSRSKRPLWIGSGEDKASMLWWSHRSPNACTSRLRAGRADVRQQGPHYIP
ncbi:hypothetical protein GJ744_012196 [Endocarpon pusillum]|uniref:Uncharacterized protein n=1 Tax=Endocarpon pusillum TaxID=364733 RepID=A0A8H7AE53_9EURO|nr:hypothetical protein GJ744_012196 [Endocarpon pusillum]